MTTVSILGGSGYAGGELLRILIQHPEVTVRQVTSRQFAGRPVTSVHPNLRKLTSLQFVSPDQLQPCDVLFVALPNGASMHMMPQLRQIAGRIIDLGADFRLHDPDVFTAWYREPHAAPELLPEFVYGIAELHRDAIRRSKYVACGGCEATVTILSLYPLVKHKLIDTPIIVDAKMSSSQGGMHSSLASHHPERAGSVRSYMPTGHRHAAEIRQELQLPETVSLGISATALDMVRGLLVTIHATPAPDVTEKDIWKAYRTEYAQEPFIRIVKEAQGIYRFPEPKILAGTNFCDIGFETDSTMRRLVVVAAIDNLVKGTAGQAVQALNIMCGYPETTGLMFPGLHPV